MGNVNQYAVTNMQHWTMTAIFVSFESLISAANECDGHVNLFS